MTPVLATIGIIMALAGALGLVIVTICSAWNLGVMWMIPFVAKERWGEFSDQQRLELIQAGQFRHMAFFYLHDED